MKTLSLLVVLHACLSSGQLWTGYSETYPKFEHNLPYFPLNWRPHLYRPPKIDKLNGAVLSPVFIPNWYNKLNAQVIGKQLYPLGPGNQYLSKADPLSKNFAGNEILRNIGGLQNNLGFNSRRSAGEDEVKQDVKKVNNYVYLLNKTNETAPRSGNTYTSVTTNLPSSSGNRYWVNENNQNYKESYWIPPNPSWNLQRIPYPNRYDVKQSPVVFYPDKNDEDLNQQRECYNVVEIIRELRLVTHNSKISDEQENFKTLLSIIRDFIVNKGLQYSSFSVVVQEIEKALLRSHNSNTLRDDEIVQLLHEFKYRDLNSLLLEISSNPDISLRVVVSKLARLLYRLKVVLIHKKFSHDTIKLVISHAVQWSVPLVGYYFEKECKIKTQQYIVQNLELALNLKLENIQHVQNLDEFQLESNFGGLQNLGGLGDLENSANIWGFENQGNLGGLGGIGNIVGPWNTVDLGNQGYLDDLGGVGSLVRLTSPGDLTGQVIGGLGGTLSQGNIGGLGNLESLAVPGSAADLVNQGILPLNQGNPATPGNLGKLQGLVLQANSGEPSKLGSVGGLETSRVLNGIGKILVPLTQGT